MFTLLFLLSVILPFPVKNYSTYFAFFDCAASCRNVSLVYPTHFSQSNTISPSLSEFFSDSKLFQRNGLYSLYQRKTIRRFFTPDGEIQKDEEKHYAIFMVNCSIGSRCNGYLSVPNAMHCFGKKLQ